MDLENNQKLLDLIKSKIENFSFTLVQFTQTPTHLSSIYQVNSIKDKYIQIILDLRNKAVLDVFDVVKIMVMGRPYYQNGISPEEILHYE